MNLIKKAQLFSALMISVFTYQKTNAQVIIVKDIHPGSSPSMPAYGENRVEYNGKLLFAAYPNASVRMELYETDGTLLGTNLVANIGGSAVSSNPQWLAVNNSKLYFSAYTGTMNYEPYVSDGTTAGTTLLKDIHTAPSNGSFPKYFTTLGSLTFFNAASSGSGYELHYTDGTTAGTSFTQINPGSASSDPGPFTYASIGNRLYFAATGANGRELYRVNCPTPTTCAVNLHFDINPGTGNSDPENLIVFNNNLHFAANDGTNGKELWLTNGTSTTYMLADINSGPGSSNPADFTEYQGKLYFSAENSSNGRELFCVNTAGTVTLVRDIVVGTVGSEPENLIVFNGKLYFTASVNGDRELWVTDGTSAGTQMVKNINPSGSSNPTELTVYGNELIFVADDGAHGNELWTSDGTSANTFLLHNINPSSGSNPRDLIIANNILFFTANNGTQGEELWKYETCSLGFSSINASACDSYTSPSGDSTWTTSGVYTDRIPYGSVGGCDSIITINLTINSATTGTDTQSSCSSITWIDGNVYNSSNNTATHTIVGGASNGCDSIVSLDLTILSPPINTVTQNQITLTADQNGGQYQWVDCNNGNSPILGETSQSFTPSTNGSYAVEVTLNSCTETSSCISINTVGIQENQNEIFEVFPNPSNGNFTINLANTMAEAKVSVSNVLGEMIYSNSYLNNSSPNINISVEPGVYFINVEQNNKFQIAKIIVR